MARRAAAGCIATTRAVRIRGRVAGFVFEGGFSRVIAFDLLGFLCCFE